MTDPRVTALAEALHKAWPCNGSQHWTDGRDDPSDIETHQAAAALAALDGWTLVPSDEFDSRLTDLTEANLSAGEEARRANRAETEIARLRKALNGFLWIGNNLHNIKAAPEQFCGMYEAALVDARDALAKPEDEMSTIDRLRALLAEATPGPWHTPGISLRPYTVYGPNDDDLARVWEAPDAALIAEAVNALPALLDVAEAADLLMHMHSQLGEAFIPHDELGLRAALAKLEDDHA